MSAWNQYHNVYQDNVHEHEQKHYDDYKVYYK